MSGKICKTINGPLGEAYSAYWDHWLDLAANRAKAQFSFDGLALNPSTPIEVFDHVADHFGTGAIFHLCRTMPQHTGFEVVKQVLEQARSAKDLARRWQTVSEQQAKVRFGADASSTQLVAQVSSNEFLLNPASQRQAKLTQFGAAMLSGAAASAFQHVSNTALEFIEIRQSGSARPIYNSNGEIGEFAADSKLLIRQTQNELPPKLKSDQYLATLSHLSNAQHIPFLRRLCAIMINGDGTHTSMDKAAHAIGLSTRTLSRRLTKAGLTYAKLMRFLKLRTASQLLAVPDLSLDEIAFRATYADRHHMARNFRQMSELSPSGFRNLIL